MKLKTLVAAVALAFAGAANAAAVLPSDALGSSLIFEAWNGTTSFTQVLGANQYGTVGTTGVGGVVGTTSNGLDQVFSLDSSALATLGTGTVQWHIVADKSTINPQGYLTTVNAGGVGTQNNTSVGSTVVGANTAFSNINTLIGANSFGTATTTSDPAYAGRPNWGNKYGVAGWSGNSNVTGFFTGVIDANTAYAAGTGIGAFYSIVQSGSGLAQAPKTAFANAQGNASWILQADGTLTYHLAAPVVASVPIPAAALLFGSGLLGLVGIGRRNKKH